MRMQIAVGALPASSCAVSRGRTGKHKNIRQTRAKTRRPGQRDRHMEFEPFCWTPISNFFRRAIGSGARSSRRKRRQTRRAVPRRSCAEA